MSENKLDASSIPQSIRELFIGDGSRAMWERLLEVHLTDGTIVKKRDVDGFFREMLHFRDDVANRHIYVPYSSVLKVVLS